MSLLILHEWGHFIVAKKLGVRVEEFGLGYPPRLISRKWGETVYSLNLLPFGAFVRIFGEDEKIEENRSFSAKPVWQRMLIVLGGVISFWLAAFIIFSLLSGIWGLPSFVSDDFAGEAAIQIIDVMPGSPAEKGGLLPGDFILGFKSERGMLAIDQIGQIQDLAKTNAGKEISLLIKRGKDIIEKKLIPRFSPPSGEGPLGLALVRVAKIKTKWYQAPLKGAEITVKKTIQIPLFLADIFSKIFKKEKISGLQIMGPVGMGALMGDALKAGVDNFLLFLAMISIWMACFNMLPVPALDGGRFFFLIIEAIRGKPFPVKLEQRITTFFFLLLVFLMAFVTFKDITHLF